MKSETLHKLPTLSTILLLLCGCVWNLPLDQQPERVQTQQPQGVQTQHLQGIRPQQSEGIQPQQPEGIQSQQSLGAQPQQPARVLPQQPILLIQNDLSPDQASNYKITIPKAPQPNEPCLTISWKTNPDGSGPDAPRIYFVDGYFQFMSPPVASTQH